MTIPPPRPKRLKKIPTTKPSAKAPRYDIPLIRWRRAGSGRPAMRRSAFQAIVARHGDQQHRQDHVEDARGDVQREDRAEDAAGEAAERDQQPNLQMHAPLQQISEGAARAIRDDQYERRPRRVGRREAEEEPEDRNEDEAAAEANHRTEDARHESGGEELERQNAER